MDVQSTFSSNGLVWFQMIYLSGHKHYQDVIMANYTKKNPKQTNMFIQPKIVFQATRAE